MSLASHGLGSLKSRIHITIISSVFLYCFKCSIGEFVLLPTDETLLVCPGKQLDITCSTNESTFLEWNVTIPHLNLSQKRTISFSNTALFVSPLDLPLSRFTFAITSKSPLMSKLSINFTTSELNGTKVLCRERANQVIDRSAEIELQIINTDTTDHLQLNSPEVLTGSETFGTHNVTITLEWPVIGNGVTYNVSIDPDSPYRSPVMRFNGSSSSGIELVLLYNIHYNVTVTATLCGQDNVTNTTEMIYVNCGEPPMRRNVSLEYNSTLLGSELLVWCDNRIFTGHVTVARCTENGYWQPDPSVHVCSSAASEQAMTSTTVAEPEIAGRENWTVITLGIGIPLVILLGAALLIVSIILIIKKGYRSDSRQTEDIILDVELQEKDIKLSKNVIYDQLDHHRQRIVLNENLAYSNVNIRSTSGL